MQGAEKGPIAQWGPRTVAGWDSLLKKLRYYRRSVPWLERTYPLSVVQSIYQAVWLKLIPAAYESLYPCKGEGARELPLVGGCSLSDPLKTITLILSRPSYCTEGSKWWR